MSSNWASISYLQICPHAYFTIFFFLFRKRSLNVWLSGQSAWTVSKRRGFKSCYVEIFICFLKGIFLSLVWNTTLNPVCGRGGGGSCRERQGLLLDTSIPSFHVEWRTLTPRFVFCFVG